eukprot:13802517-Ditylum_brightwellii.AAC.1
MKAEYNFFIQVYRNSDPDKQFGQINSTSKGTEHHWKCGGNVLNTNYFGVSQTVMKLLKESFDGENVNCVVRETFENNVKAGLLSSDCHFSYKSMKHGTTNFFDNPSKFVFGTTKGNHALNFLAFDEEHDRFERPCLHVVDEDVKALNDWYKGNKQM